MCKQQRAFLVFCVTAMNFFSFGLKFAHAAFIHEIHDKFAQCVSIKCQKEYQRKAPTRAIRKQNGKKSPIAQAFKNLANGLPSAFALNATSNGKWEQWNQRHRRAQTHLPAGRGADTLTLHTGGH